MGNPTDRSTETGRITRRTFLAAGAALPVWLSSSWARAASVRPAIAPWGFDLSGMDRTVRPGDDFFRYGGGGWLRTTDIPPDRSIWGPFYELRAKAEADVRVILEELAGSAPPPGTEARKIADFYTAYLDVAAIEAAGLAPAKADLTAIANAASHEDIARLSVRPDLGIGGVMSIDIWADDRDPNRYVVNISQGGLGLPSRDYYLKADQQSASVRDKYRTYIAKLLGLASWPNTAAVADAVLMLETRIAALHWPEEKKADRNLTYNPRSRAELNSMAPEFPWDATFEALEIPRQNRFGVKEPDAIQGLSKLFRATSVADWRAYLGFHYLNAAADVLPRAFDDLAFDFNGRILSGTSVKSERWKRATANVNRALGEAVGRHYVTRHFPSEAKAQARVLVENLRTAFGEQIRKADWMSPATRRAALRKLNKMRVKIGYPDVWRDYSTLDVRPDDPLGNRARARLWDWRRRAARLDRPTDRDEWGMTPQTVNAYYNAFFNEIVFPAAILQPPYFDPAADAAVNYGGIGGVIGHEMSHGFDDQGSKSDENGVLRSWWTPEDRKRFEARIDAFKEQYSRYEALPGLHLNGRMTLAENIGDNSGLAIALDAYRLSLGGRPAPVLDGFTGEQRFFLSWSQTYREKIREAQLRQNLATDPHSPCEFRVNGVVRNMDAWYAAFEVKAGDKLYVAPSERGHVW
jgi:putative endopeptidase